MSTELKIGVVLGIVVVVVALVFFVGQEEEPTVAPAAIPVEPIELEDEPEPVDVAPPAVEEEPVPESVEMVPPKSVEEEVEVPSEPEVVPVAEEPKVEPRYHVVGKNETLFGISQKYYGQGRHWKVILEANRDVIKDENKLTVGWKLRIPSAREVSGAGTD